MNQSLTFFWGLLLFASITSCENSTEGHESIRKDSQFSEKVDQYLNAHAANGRFSGNVLIAKGDSILYSNSFGMASHEFGIENFDSTKFLIGSITKPFTALAILLLEKQGKLSLDEKLSKFFPNFPEADRVNIKQLLTHTSGIRDYHAFENWREDSKSDKTTPQFTIEKVATKPFIFEPGLRFSYSNSGYILLGLIIEKVSNQTFEAFIQSEILNPLELKNTGVITNEKLVHQLAQGYSTSPREVEKAAYINYNQPFSSGNMYSTPIDLWRFTQAVMKCTLLPKSKTNEIFENNLGKYGYGWGIRNYEGKKAYGHFGGMNGFVGSITYIPDGEYFVCFLTNDDNTPKNTIAEDLTSITMGKDVANPVLTSLIDLTDKMVKAAAGDYLIKAGDTLHVFEENDHLFIKETGQEQHELFPIGNNEYSLVLIESNVSFSEIKEGEAQELKLLGKANLSAKRINPKNVN